jgi:hypothetical protein
MKRKAHMHPHHRGRRWRRWGLLYIVVVPAFAVIGLTIEAAVNPGPREPQSLAPTAIPTPPWATTSARPKTHETHKAPNTDRTRDAAMTGPVQLVQGQQLINGVYLGYPHSTTGAVSAAVEFLATIGSTLDPDRAAAVMRMTADPTYSGAPGQAAEGAINDRKSLGLPASGPVPAGASLETEPIEYQVRGVTTSRVTVLLLCDFVAAMPGGGTQTTIGVFPVRLHWTENDWSILPPKTTSYADLTAEPGSPRAAQLGWQSLQPAGGR